MARIMFNAHKKQILRAAALAANAAKPVGLGFLHYDPYDTFTESDMKPYWNDHQLDVDYHKGRCVKFNVWSARHYGWSKHSKGHRYVTGFETDEHYETWCGTYPTYVKLLEAAGIRDWVLVDPK